ncbi:xanthine dehydrogenase family protein molybdopterin-binding subunit [Nonomuraea longicatena]|uniref:Xanthine dehydrogenase family protein molybdopterin-binding subunit n=1 Tax=Nonomuraea longicatena TaxID=83682 RepID=A0ABP3ZBP9_9ACTN
MTETLVPTTTAPHVGRPIDRVDGPAKTTGSATFAAEFPFPGLAHASLVHAEVGRARITAIDTAQAEAVTGVITVLTHLNAPTLRPAPKFSVLDLSTIVSGTAVNYLNTDQVHWNGQPVAVVVAETYESARHAARLVGLTYEELPATVDFAAAESSAKPQKSNPMMGGGGAKGDAEAALAQAPVTVDQRYTTPELSHNALEPHATIAAWDGDKLTVYESSQSLPFMRRHLAKRLDLPEDAIRLVAPFVGGGFGGKGNVWAGTILAVLAARAAGRPVRLSLTREAVYRTVGGRTRSTQRVALGAEPGGALAAIIHTSVTRTSAVGGFPEAVTNASGHLYAAPNILLKQHVVEMDLLPNAPMRAPGEAIGTFALESAVDELAAELGLDPIDVRLRNDTDRDPLSGTPFSHRRLREAFALGAERFGWSARTPQPGSMREGRWLVGYGVAAAYHPIMMLAANLTVRLAADGTVIVRCGFHEMGMGGATVQAQIAADALGVPFEAVRVDYGDTDLPTGPMAGGSMQTASVAASLLEACAKIKTSLLALARRSGSPLRGSRADAVEARDGGLYLVGHPDQGESYASILSRAGRSHVEVSIGSDGLGSKLKFMTRFIRDQRRWVRAASGAQFCEVRVDADTGEIRLARWLGAFDIGRVANLKTATSQMRGGIVMGMGMALSEETLVDPRHGRIVNPGLAEYHIPVHADVPPIDVHFLDDPDPTMPLGLLGAGEVSITGVAAAVANAVYHATGRRVRDLPITLDKLL